MLMEREIVKCPWGKIIMEEKLTNGLWYLECEGDKDGYLADRYWAENHLSISARSVGVPFPKEKGDRATMLSFEGHAVYFLMRELPGLFASYSMPADEVRQMAIDKIEETQ